MKQNQFSHAVIKGISYVIPSNIHKTLDDKIEYFGNDKKQKATVKTIAHIKQTAFFLIKSKFNAQLLHTSGAEITKLRTQVFRLFAVKVAAPCL